MATQILLPEVDVHTNATKNMKVVLEKNSLLVINGKTNVNNFKCSYEGTLPYDTMSVEVSHRQNKFIIDNASASVQVKNFNCGASGITNDFRELLKVNKYPQLKIDILNFTLLPSEKNKYDWESGKAEVVFTIAGESVVYPVNFNIEDNNEDKFYVGDITIDITDFGLEPPKKFLGLLVVDKEVEIDFRINFKII